MFGLMNLKTRLIAFKSAGFLAMNKPEWNKRISIREKAVRKNSRFCDDKFDLFLINIENIRIK